MEQSANPQVFNSPINSRDIDQVKKSPGTWFRRNIIKVVIIILVIAVLGELFYGGMTLFGSATSKELLAPRVSPLVDANLSLVLDKTKYKSGDNVVVDVKLFTGGNLTDSTDLVVKYDPAFLKPNAQKFAEAGKVYSEFPAIQIDEEKGLIGISGITTPGSQSFEGVGSFSKLYFTALKDGQTQVTIDFDPGATADSNVVLSGSSKDILGSVKNADVLISGTSENAPVGNDQSCASFIQYCQGPEGRAGTQVCQGGSTKNGSCGYDAEFTVSCEVCKIE